MKLHSVITSSFEGETEIIVHSSDVSNSNGILFEEDDVNEEDDGDEVLNELLGFSFESMIGEKR